MVDNTKIRNCNCEQAVKKQTEHIEQESFAMTIFKDSAKNAKRWFKAFLIVTFLWFATMGCFIYYLAQYDFSSYSVDATQDGQGINVVGGGDTIYYGSEGSDNHQAEK